MRFDKSTLAYAGVIALVACLAGSSAKAVSNQLDWSTIAKVTDIDASAAPGMVAFQIDADAGDCPAGHWLVYSPPGSDTATQDANSQALVDLLQTSNGSGVSVSVSGFNASCVVQSVALTQ